VADASRERRLGTRQVIRSLCGLTIALGVMWLTTRFTGSSTPESLAGVEAARVLASLGFLLLAGSLCAELLEPLGLPHLTGYLAAGLLAGPYVLALVDGPSVVALQKMNGLALALIAFAAGAELSLDMLRSGLGRLTTAVAAQVVVLPVALGAVFYLASRWMPFLAGQSPTVVLGLALLWGVTAAVKSPAAVLGVLAETRADGPLARYAVAMVVVLDVAVLVIFQLALLAARSMMDPAAGMSFEKVFVVGHALLSSLALGTTLGLLTGLYLATVDRGVILFLLGLAFATSQLDAYFGYDSMLVFAVAGFVVQNLTRQGPKLLAAVHQSGSIIFVVFFAAAGADLDLTTLRQLWPMALLLAAARGFATAGAAAAASKISGESPAVRRWGWTPLISQAGVALGIAIAVEAAFPSFGKGFRSLAIAVVGLNEAVGPIVFKLSLARAGEVGPAAE
jgi:Kef-type K+ transport system membrane component KefB